MDEKKAEEKVDESRGGSKGKYTELELRDRGVGKFIGTQ